jgi:hypothetical protein
MIAASAAEHADAQHQEPGDRRIVLGLAGLDARHAADAGAGVDHHAPRFFGVFPSGKSVPSGAGSGVFPAASTVGSAAKSAGVAVRMMSRPSIRKWCWVVIGSSRRPVRSLMTAVIQGRLATQRIGIGSDGLRRAGAPSPAQRQRQHIVRLARFDPDRQLHAVPADRETDDVAGGDAEPPAVASEISTALPQTILVSGRGNSASHAFAAKLPSRK